VTEKPCLVYVGFYDYDPVSRRGFVYLPGRGERWHDLDINLLYRGDGVDGHWFAGLLTIGGGVFFRRSKR
jgi:hypothetical protein